MRYVVEKKPLTDFSDDPERSMEAYINEMAEAGAELVSVLPAGPRAMRFFFREVERQPEPEEAEPVREPEQQAEPAETESPIEPEREPEPEPSESPLEPVEQPAGDEE